jgi:hypothetical protein
MAKVTPGPLAGVISGAVGNVVFARGRYGAYIRSRVIPTLVQNDYTGAVRDRLILLSRAWAVLDVDEKLAWRTWAATHPTIDRVGAVQVLQPSAAFISLNARVLQCGGSQIDLPPIAESPSPVTGSAISASEGSNLVEVAWTSGSMGGVQHLAVWLALYDSAGKSYYRNLLKLVTVSLNGASSPLDITSDVVARYGAFVAGQVMKCELEVWDRTTGYVSSRAFCEGVVAA